MFNHLLGLVDLNRDISLETSTHIAHGHCNFSIHHYTEVNVRKYNFFDMLCVMWTSKVLFISSEQTHRQHPEHRTCQESGI